MKKVSERILKSLNKLEGEIGKVYGECYCSKISFTAEKLKEFLDSMGNVKECFEADMNYADGEEFSDDYQDYFVGSILKSIRNKRDLRYVESALDDYNCWASLCDWRQLGKLEFMYRLINMDITISEDETLNIPESLKK